MATRKWRRSKNSLIDPNRARYRRTMPDPHVDVQFPNVRSFRAWFVHQRSRFDAVGHLSRNFGSDPCWPAKAQHYQVCEDHIVEVHNASILDIMTLRRAWREWKDYLAGVIRG